MGLFSSVMHFIHIGAETKQKGLQAQSTLKRTSAALGKSFPNTWASAKHYQRKLNQRYVRPYTSRAANAIVNRFQPLVTKAYQTRSRAVKWVESPNRAFNRGAQRSKAKVAFNDAAYKKPGFTSPNGPRTAIPGVKVNLSGLPPSLPKQIGAQRLLTTNKTMNAAPPKLPSPAPTRKH